jgi:hypothetical protein
MKPTQYLIGLVALMSFVPNVLATTLQSMTKEQIKQTIINKTLVSIPTDNLNGKTINNTFSMYMDGKGHIYGSMSLKPDNEPQSDKGIYTLEEDGTVTIIWEHWDRKEKLFAQLFETKNAYLAIGLDNVFHTAYLKESILPGNKLSLPPE